uniref:Uncharacterized protein n=1 Tax=Strigamia maritima TaxID=126957 RepID=T1J8R3_STRMM
MGGFCTYLTCEQIMTFTAYSTFETIELVQEKYTQFPPLAVCIESQEIYDEKAKVKVKNDLNNTCVEDVDILELLDEPSIFSNNAQLLWQETIKMENLDFAEVVIKEILLEMSNIISVFGKKTYISTVFGNCIHLLQSRIIKYTSKDTAMYLAYQAEGLRCNSQSKIFLMQTQKRININIFAMQPHNSLMVVEFFKQTIQRLNSPINPCVTKKQAKRCETDCLRNKLLQENIECRLPFMNSSSLPMCNTSASAKLTRRSYLSVYSNIDAIRDCKCHPTCNQILYTAFSEYIQSYQFAGIIITKFQFKTNVNEIFKQKFVMPFAKCICDIGSIFGFFLEYQF